MSRSARWTCHLCATNGSGGPDGWRSHAKQAHAEVRGASSMIAFGFVPSDPRGRRANLTSPVWCEVKP